jgi:hypothetical protein
LRDLDNGRATFRRVILETTGLADPAPVLQTAMAHPYLAMRYRLDGVITVVDAINGATTLDAHGIGEAGGGRRSHRAHQDRSLAAPGDRAAAGTRRRARSTQPRPSRCRSWRGSRRLLACGLYDPNIRSPTSRWLAAGPMPMTTITITITATM